MGRFIAQFESEAFERIRACPENRASSAAFTGEGNLVHIGMLDEALASTVLTVSGNHVDNTRRKTGFLGYLCKLQRGDRCDLRRFQNNCAAGCKRWREFPADRQHRSIPRRDGPDHTDRHPRCEDMDAVVHRDGLPLDFVGQ